MIEGPNDKGRWEVQVPLGRLRLVEFYCWQICQVDYQCETKTPGSKLVMSVGASNASSPSLAMRSFPVSWVKASKLQIGDRKHSSIPACESV